MTITVKDGNLLSADVYVQVTREVACPCGYKGDTKFCLPKGIVYEDEINLRNHCPQCGKTLVIPYGHHYIEDNKLLTKPLL